MSGNSKDPVEQLTTQIAKLPGLGKRSARRIIFDLIQKREQLLEPLLSSLSYFSENVQECQTCFNVSTQLKCEICQSRDRLNQTLCVVENVPDLWALERSQVFSGVYHVLGGTLSAIEGRGPSDLRLQQLVDRIKSQHISEIILALNMTIDGQMTARYIQGLIAGLPVKVSALTQGVPVGGELDYLDEGTITIAFQTRNQLRR